MLLPRLLMLVLICLFPLFGWADTIAVVIPRDTVLTRNFVEALSSRLPADRLEVHVLGITPVPDSASLLVTMGQEALQWRLTQPLHIPTIATYVTLDGLRELHDSVRPSSVQILLASAKPDRQLLLAQLLIPHMDTAGLLVSDQQQWQQRFWQAAAARHGVTLYARSVSDPAELPRRLSDVLNESDVLVGLDDPAIYNAENLKTLLLTSYARRRVLIGPSAPFIAAGSLSTTYSTPENMAESVIATWRQPWKPAAIRYPEQFSVLSNAQVAHSLGLPPPDDGELMRRILAMEQTR